MNVAEQIAFSFIIYLILCFILFNITHFLIILLYLTVRILLIIYCYDTVLKINKEYTYLNKTTGSYESHNINKFQCFLNTFKTEKVLKLHFYRLILVLNNLFNFKSVIILFLKKYLYIF